jgi:O-antigen ligase
LRFKDIDIHAPFVLLILYALLTWGIKTVTDPSYSAMRGGITLKNQLIDLYLFFLVFRYGLHTLDDYLWMFKAVIGTLLLSSVLTLVDVFNVPDLGIINSFKGRVEGPIGAANQYGALLAFLIPLMVSLVPTTSGKGRALWLAGIAASILLLVATGSRGAYVSIVFGSIAATIFLRRYLSARVIMRGAVAGIVLLVLAALVVLTFQAEVFEEVASKSQADDTIRASSGRTAIWGAAFALMNQWPLSWIIGFGWNAFEESGLWKSAHSVYVDLVYELGIVGVVLFVWLFIALLRRARIGIADAPEDFARILKAYVFGLVPLLMTMAFVEIPQPQSLFWMTSGLIFGILANRHAKLVEPVPDVAGSSQPRRRAVY